MSIGEEVLFRMTLRAGSAYPFQNSIPRTRNENFLLKSSSENNGRPIAALRAVGAGGLRASQKRRFLINLSGVRGEPISALKTQRPGLFAGSATGDQKRPRIQSMARAQLYLTTVSFLVAF
jgi:hypothetical protein